MADYPDINGNRYDWSSVEIDIEGSKPLIGIKSIDYSHKLEGTKVRGTHAQPIGRTRGEYEADGSITLFKEEAAQLRAALGNGYMERSFVIVVSYCEPGKPIITDVLVGCRIKNEGDSHNQGTDALEEKLDLDVMFIDKNGVTPLRRMLPFRSGA